MLPCSSAAFAEMRASGVRGLLIYYSDYKCNHLISISRAHRFRVPQSPSPKV
jgi:hypothetical protein